MQGRIWGTIGTFVATGLVSAQMDLWPLVFINAVAIICIVGLDFTVRNAERKSQSVDDSPAPNATPRKQGEGS